MARVADYVIIADGWQQDDSITNTIKFNVPTNINVGSRCVLTFMFKVESLGPMSFAIGINGNDVWNWTASGAVDPPIRTIQEVVGANIVRPGENVFTFHAAGDWHFDKISDVVLWFQADI